MRILKWQSSRRRFLGAGSVLSGLIALPAQRLSAFAGGVQRGAKGPSVYERLGVRTRINAKGTYTFLTGSLMPPEVSRAMEEASQHFVWLPELHEAVGKKLAELLGVEAARKSVV